MRATFVAACALSFLYAVVGQPGASFSAATAQEPASDEAPAVEPIELDEELAQQKAIVDRFLVVLQRNPRRGTALDKIYGYHVDAGTLEEFSKELRASAEKENDGAGWMILGLVESQRGRDASAVEALRKAVELRPEDPLAPYYLGQSLVLVGQPDEAVSAFETSIERKPAANDLLEIFQALGRVHQRAQRVEEALAVWKRLEALFPGDARVQERIASALSEEGQYAEALPRYEALAASTDDDYRRTSFQLQAAELKVKLDRSKEGIADLEGVLAKLNPDNWLFREVRKKIEDVFLRTEDREGLTAYYEKWLDTHPEDVDAMARLARTLTSQGRIPEARDRLEKALKLAPSRSDLRTAFIAQLIETKNYAAALEQYAALDELDPGNPDRLREWGKLHLRDEARPKEEREQSAAAVWRRIVDARPDDPLAAAQTADLFRRAEMNDEALALYRKAVQLAPAAPQYREYLGEFLHILERTDEAREVWREIAAGDLRTAENLALLADILVRFGYLEEALPEIAAACELEPKDFALHLQAADFRVRAERYDEAFTALDAAEALAQNEEERESVLSRRISALQSADLLEDRVEAMEQKIASEPAAEDWFLLARYREALRRLPEATAAIEKALELRPGDIRSLSAAARIAESGGELQKAADLNRRLATADRRGRTTYLERIASLESQLGRTEQALAAGRELIAAAPGNVDAYQFFADLCARLNRHDEGIAALRRATRVNPNEPNLSLSLAAALADRFRTDEAIEIYWQAFEKAGSLDDQLLVIGKQTELYLQSNRLDQLLERLERGRSEPEGRREATICLAQAYHSAGDYGMARQELETLLNENSRDTQLLQQLSKLAEGESDLTSAIQFQERLAEVAPGAETEYRLATLLAQSGDAERSADIFVRLSLAEEDRAKVVRNVDRLLNSSDHATALTIVQAKRGADRDDWELLYREGAALTKLDRKDEARERFAALLELSLPDDRKSVTAPRASSAAGGSGIAGGSSVASRSSRTPSIYAQLSQHASETSTVARVLQIDPRYANYGYSQTSFWSPTSFGAARTASLGQLYLIADASGKAKEFIAERQSRAEAEEASAVDAVDWYRLRSLLGDPAETRGASKLLARRGILAGQYLYLSQIANGRIDPRTPNRVSSDDVAPLPEDELELALACYEALDAADGDSKPTSGISSGLVVELDRAGRQEEAEEIYQREVTTAETADQITGAMSLAVSRKDFAGVATLFARFAETDLAERRQKAGVPAAPPSVLAQAAGSGQFETEQALDLLDAYLDWRSAATAIDRERTTSRRSSPFPAAGEEFGYQYFVNGTYQRGQETMLVPFESFDSTSVSLLRSVYEDLRKKDVVSDLTERLERIAGDPAASGRDVRLYALAYVNRWSDDQEGYVDAVRRSVELQPQDFQLRLASAVLHQSLGELDEALAVVDGLAPVDQTSMQRRETLALDLAVRLGDRDRARDAARRLFGLRLPSETQVALASQMRRLGMNEEADAALARAGNQAGGRLSALAALMSQYQSQGNRQVAVEIAYQILRRSRTAAASPSPYMATNSDQAYRQMALQCLASTGQLDESIAQLKEQIERSPQATQLYETLAEYCRAKGDTEQEFAVLEKLIELKPKDAAVRVDFANRLAGKGKNDQACDLYLAALETDSNVLNDEVYRWVQAFRAAKRMDDFLAAVDRVDFKRIRQPYVIVNLISNLSQQADQAPLAAKLLKKAWADMPTMRTNLLSSLYSDEIWKDPEILELAIEGVIPPDDGKVVSPWYGFEDGIRSYNSDGRITTTATKILESCDRDGTTADLRQRVAAATERRPEWRAGSYLLLAIDVRAKKTENLEARVEELLKDPRDTSSSRTGAAWFVAQEIEVDPSRRELALKIYESLSDQPGMTSQFRYSPRYRVFQLYRDLGQPEKATALLHQALDRDSSSSDPYERGQLVQDFLSVGSSLAELGEPLEAVRVYRRLLSDPQLDDPEVARYYGGTPDRFRRQAMEGLESALAAAMKLPDSDETVAAILDATLASSQGNFDLMSVEQEDSEYGLPTLKSPALELILAAGAASQEKLIARLRELSVEHPDDFGIAVAMATVLLQGEDGPAAREAVERVVALAERSPLEPIAEGKRPNSRQRDAAEIQTCLWFVAREAYETPELRDVANVLADRAVEAAARQLESRRLLAILFERGKLAHDAGELEVAEAVWNDLIDRYLVNPGRVQVGEKEPRRVPATVTQFETATALAVAAADRQMPTLSMRAISEALAGGLPVQDTPADVPFSGGQPVRMIQSSSSVGRESPELAQVAGGVRRASQAWRRAKVSPTEASQALESIVLSPTRPQEILLLASPISLTSSEAHSVARELAYWAVAANRVDEVAAAVASRKGSVDDEIAGVVLLALIEVERKDPAALAERLSALQTLTKQSAPAVQAVAAHPAIAAFAVPELAKAALPFVHEAVLQLAGDQTSGGSRWAYGSDSGGLPTKLVTALQEQGQTEQAGALVDRLLDIRRQFLTRQGDWGFAYYRSDLANFADAQAQAGDVATTLKALARFLDAPLPGEARRYGAPGNPERAAALLRRQLAAIEPGRRYELLRDWTLPDETRRTLRSSTYMEPVATVRGEFLPEEERAIETQGGTIVSTIGLLVDAAKEAGRLPELSAATAPLIEAKLPDADLLDLLIRIASADAAAASERFKAFAEEARKRPDDAPTEQAPDSERSAERQLLEAFVAAAGLRQAGVAASAEEFLEAMAPEYDHRNQSALQKFASRELTRRRAERAGGDPEAPFRSPGLDYWHAENGVGAAAGPIGPVWVAHDGIVAHLAGRAHDRLLLKYPVVGEFRLSFESTTGWAKQGEICYGGVFVEPQPWAKQLYISSATTGDGFNRPGLPQHWEDGWDRMAVHVSPGSVRWYVNGMLAYEDTSPSPTSPWLYLDCFDERRTHFRNLRLEGAPQIPREVALIEGSFVDGWYPGPPEGTTVRLADSERKRLGSKSEPNRYRGQVNPVWTAADGTLTARVEPGSPTDMPSLLTYFRPIQKGETLSYEFFWEPGAVEVHPAIGNVAMRLTDQGVRLRHYVHPQMAAGFLSHLAAEEVDVPEYSRSDEALPLRAGEWNRAEIRVEAGEAALVLNDVEVFALPIDPARDRRFGFFRFADRDEVRVRNVRLRGDWPAEFPAKALEDPLAMSEAPSAAVRLARHAAVGELIYAERSLAVSQAASTLPPEERYEFLKAWVLPNEDHPTFRLATAFTPLNPPALDLVELAEPTEASRIHRGGEIVAPAFDLVKVAAELGRLEQLSAEIDAAAALPGVEPDPRGVEGLRTAIDVARGDVESARARLKKALVSAESVPPTYVPSQRGAEVVAVLAALESPALLEDARTLAKRLVQIADAEGTAGAWRPDARRLWSVARSTGDPDAGTREAAVPSGLSRWDAVTFPTAATRGAGLPPASWRVVKGEAEFLTGNTKDAIYFDTPLRGDFELTCSLGMGYYREMRAVYAGSAMLPTRDGKEFRFQPFGRSDRVVAVNPPMKISDRVAFRMTVRGGEMILQIDGREVARERIPDDVDPWLGFSSKESYCYGSVRDVRITGSPAIPKEIPLFHGPELNGGRASYYEESIGGDPPDWLRSGDEIVAKKTENAEGRFQESVLQYHRPLMEDGEVEYEFFWKKGETEVHPALDRLAFVLRPEGVGLHAMTDGKWDQTGALPNDVRNIEGAVAVPLKEGDWNRARLVVEGDVATLFVNDVQVASRRLASTNQRNFGLFRWSDVSGVRVRNVVHRGEWPDALPAEGETGFARTSAE